MQTNGGYFVGPGYVSNWSVPNSGMRCRRQQSTAVLYYHAKHLNLKEMESEMKRKKRIAKYKSVATERNVKASITKALRWFKNKIVICKT